MDTSMVARMKELEAENARLKKMYAEERLKAEILKEAIEKSGEAISPSRDDQTSRCWQSDISQARLRTISCNAIAIKPSVTPRTIRLQTGWYD